MSERKCDFKECPRYNEDGFDRDLNCDIDGRLPVYCKAYHVKQEIADLTARFKAKDDALKCAKSVIDCGPFRTCNVGLWREVKAIVDEALQSVSDNEPVLSPERATKALFRLNNCDKTDCSRNATIMMCDCCTTCKRDKAPESEDCDES